MIVPTVRLATFIPPGSTSPVAGAVVDGRLVAYAAGVRVVDLLARADPIPSPDGADYALDQVRLLSPVQPGVLYGVGLNYAAHAAEQGSKLPEQPIIFTMQPGAAANPGDDVVCPAVVLRLDYEGELAIVIGGGGAIAGYCVADDVSARDLQHREKQWTRAKGFDGAVPFGPWVTTVDEVPDPCALRLRTWVNDELRQDTNTADMIFRPQQVVDFIAETCTLRPGDVIVTGTPSGVGMSMDPPRFLHSGDRIRIAIDGLGEIAHRVA
jgi:2-keto-4-pentenoate hydratase/2-oxohepta-3-ene-1,7-dioic acid hydratase in catechol pathway